MKKAGIVGLVSLFGLVGCTTKTKTVYVTQKQEPQIVYVDRPVEVEKTVYVDKPVEVEKTVYVDRPVEVEKTVYVDRPIEVEKLVEVEKIVYVEKSYATIKNMKVEKIGDNLYRKEFDFTIGNYCTVKEDKEFLELFTTMPKGYSFANDKSDWYVYDTITTKAGFIIQDISFVNLEYFVSKPTLYDRDYNTYKTNEEIDRPQIGGSHKFSYSNLNKEQISVNVPKETELWDETAYGYRKLVITFSLRGE